MANRFGSMVSHVPVAVAALLVATCLTGAQLYSSSAGSAAVDEQVRETCRSDSALILPIPPDSPGAEEKVRAIGNELAFVAPPRRGALARPLLRSQSALPRRLRLIWLEGADVNVNPHLVPLGPGEIALSTSNLSELQVDIGSELILDGGVRLTVTQSFDDIPFAPTPEFWCGYDEYFMPTAGGDLPPPFAIASLDTIAGFGGQSVEFDEYQITHDPITLTDAGALERSFRTAETAWTRTFTAAPRGLERNELTNVVGRARSVHTAVDRNLAPVLLTGLSADLVVLIAAGVLVARERRRELKLLAVRGVHPARIGLLVAPTLAWSVVTGAAAGLVIAWTAVKLFGPSPLLEPKAVIGSAIDVAVGVVVAVVVVAAVVAAVADGYVDLRRARVGTRAPMAFVMVLIVALAVIAYRRLDERGGVRTSGVRSSGGDLLAMGFPLFALLAVITVAGLLVAWITPRWRLSGARLGRAVRLGWRRVVLESGPLAAIIMSIALAAGCFTVAIALSAGAQRQLHDKAEVYVGADLAISVFDDVDVPADWSDRTTVISRVRAKRDGAATDVLGVDPATFAKVARLRGDGSSKSLDDLVADIAGGAAGDPIDVIAVGGSASVGDVVQLAMRGTAEPVPVVVVDTARFFPGKKSGVPLFVMARARLEEIVQFPGSILVIRDPPDNALETIRASGVRTGLVLDASSSFDGSAYSALRWAYVPLAALGVLFAVVALSLQLLVVSARREQRRIAHALMVRTGFTRRSAWVAAAVETGIPLVVGTVVGVAAAVVAASLAIRRLDPMPLLDPPARFLVPWPVLLGATVIVAAWTAIIATAIVRSTERADPMRVFQGAP